MPNVSVMAPPFISGIPSSIYVYDSTGNTDFTGYTQSTVYYNANGIPQQTWKSGPPLLTAAVHPTSAIDPVTPPGQLLGFLWRFLLAFFPGSIRSSSGKLTGNLQNPTDAHAEPIKFGPIDVTIFP